MEIITNRSFLTHKERISYLEGENKKLVEMLSKLISNTQTVQNCKNVNNKNTTVTKDKMCETELSSTNYCVNEEVRDIPLIVQENHNGEDLNGYRVIKKQLREVRKTKHEQYLKSHSRMKTTLNDNNVIRKATIIGDSMLNGINDDNLSTENIKSCVKYISGAKICDINAKIENLLTDKPDLVLLHVGTNNACDMTSNKIVDDLLSLKHRVEKLLPKAKVIISSIITRTDDGKADYTIRKANELLGNLKLNLLDNSNITHKDLGKRGLHLSKTGKIKWARYILEKLKSLS